MSKRFVTGFQALILLVFLLVLSGCSGNGSNSAGDTGSIAVHLQWNDTKSNAKSLAAAPAGVVRVRITISGGSMETMQQEFDAAAGNGSFSGVPAGSGITVSAQGLNSAGVVTHGGSVSNVTVRGGETTVVGPILMESDAFTCTVSGSARTTSGAAIPGVLITLTGTTTATTTTDDNGNYQFIGVSEGSYTLNAAKSGYTFTPGAVPLTVGPTCPESKNFTGTAPVLCTVSGSVKTASGNAISGAAVSLAGAAVASVHSDTNGNFQIANVVPGSYTLSVAKTGYTFSTPSVQVTITDTCPVAQNFIGTSTAIVCSVSGNVSTTGTIPVILLKTTAAALSGATVTLTGPGVNLTTTTDASGNYQFTNIPGGNYTLSVAKTGYSFSPPSVQITITDTCPAVQNFIGTSTSLACSVAGNVSTPPITPVVILLKTTAAAVPGATVYLTGSGVNLSATTDANGNYQFINIPEGNYTLSVAKAGYTFSPSTASLTISSSCPAAQNFIGTLYCPVYGSVKTPFGGAISGAMINLYSNVSGLSATTDAYGNYTINNVAQGNYTLYVWLPGYAFTPSSISLSFGSTCPGSQNFTGEANSSLVYGYIYYSGTSTPLSGFTVSLSGAASRTTTTNSSGYYQFSGLKAGTYTVTAIAKPGYGINAPASVTFTLNGTNSRSQNFSEYIIIY